MHIHQVRPWLLLSGSSRRWCFSRALVKHLSLFLGFWTLTVLLAGLPLCRFLLRCDFQRRRAPAGFQPLWFVADDGTILARQFAASNHGNKRGGELSGSWALSQVMSPSASTNSPHLSSPNRDIMHYCWKILPKPKVLRLCGLKRTFTRKIWSIKSLYNPIAAVCFIHRLCVFLN